MEKEVLKEKGSKIASKYEARRSLSLKGVIETNVCWTVLYPRSRHQGQSGKSLFPQHTYTLSRNLSLSFSLSSRLNGRTFMWLENGGNTVNTFYANDFQFQLSLFVFYLFIFLFIFCFLIQQSIVFVECICCWLYLLWLFFWMKQSRLILVSCPPPLKRLRYEKYPSGI